MDKSAYRRKVILDLVSSPWTLLPAAAGLSALLLDWATGSGLGWISFLGVSGVLTGLGSLTTQWLFRWDKLTQKAFIDLQAAERQKDEAALDDLDKQLQRDGDPRTKKSLREMRDLRAAFQANQDWATKMNHDSAIEISNKMDKLFKGCIISLQRSLEIWETSKKMRTAESRKQVLDSRERIIAEVVRSVQQMAKTADEVQSFTLTRDNTESLDRIRRELDQSLVVARRVEERMGELDRELGDAPVEDEEPVANRNSESLFEKDRR